MKKIDLKGVWNFCLDKEKEGIKKQYYNRTLEDIIDLPATVSTAGKGTPSGEENTGHLTDPWLFEGYTWYSREVDFSEAEGKEFFLVLERTRISHVWIDEDYVGSADSLCTSHRYRVTPYGKTCRKITIMIDNTSYPVTGGHMTSPDTQSNWNGITGGIYIEEYGHSYLDKVRIYPNGAGRYIDVRLELEGTKEEDLTIFVSGGDHTYPTVRHTLYRGENRFRYSLEETAQLWSEHTPNLYRLHMELSQAAGAEDRELYSYVYSFGLRDFEAAGNYFEINGMRTFLRGKHDGMIFPLTGHAPADVSSWLKVLETAKQYGINHYRFHTCCPPEAAFTAADMLGIYMEPELPFWGTVTEPGEESHDERGQKYLMEEGFRILDEFGNHPSFVMMSLGNELWGSKSRLNRILGDYKKYDSRHLYTQGSNNFQFMPCILENEDFFCGVRFSKTRLFRGSYAMCDAPQGHIQTMPPDTVYDYDSVIRPPEIEQGDGGENYVTIQFGTGIKTVKMEEEKELIPRVPVVSHEIGQYAMYPDFSEIDRYTGVLKARNLEVFKRNMEKKGMLPMAERFFRASGRFAADCYKLELETALRSKELAGFQILDLQDFTGQGTACIGILNAFMESKGIITPKEWRQFCSERVILAMLPGLVYEGGEQIDLGITLAIFHPQPVVDPQVELCIYKEEKSLVSRKEVSWGEFLNGVYELGRMTVTLPELAQPEKWSIHIRLAGTEIENRYDIWVYPKEVPALSDKKGDSAVIVTGSTEEAKQYFEQGRKVLLYPEHLDDTNSVSGTYCTDFWCYPMFRSISESMGKPLPVGTHGLYIEKDHKVFQYFPTEFYTTPQWYDMVSHSRALILDASPVEPIVWTIDNSTRNHKLGNMFERKAGEGRLFVCTWDLRRQRDSAPARWLEYSIMNYMAGTD
ncbi:glycoside hydrolase family 2 TIM barrel-domain containing protein [Kineothrix sedimenti]|uniref:beta-galactosidase n=1 Tax=Kineothrix sedimenti TaxID=3123317 RepID=A0ABZ3ETB7_9FIRM